MDLELYDCGCPVGTLHMEKTGLYQTITCVCHPLSEGVARVYVWKGTEGACLGVLCPEGADYTLRKRVSRAGLPFTPETAVIGCEDQEFRPFRGEVDGHIIEDGYLKISNGNVRVAVPIQEGEESDVSEHPSCRETITICGRPCVLLGEEPEAPEEPGCGCTPDPMPEPTQPPEQTQPPTSTPEQDPAPEDPAEDPADPDTETLRFHANLQME